MNNIKISTPFIRLDSFLKLCGVSDTGGQSKLIIKSGKILVDGQVCVMRGKKLYPGAVVGAEGKIFAVAADN